DLDSGDADELALLETGDVVEDRVVARVFTEPDLAEDDEQSGEDQNHDEGVDARGDRGACHPAPPVSSSNSESGTKTGEVLPASNGLAPVFATTYGAGVSSAVTIGRGPQRGPPVASTTGRLRGYSYGSVPSRKVDFSIIDEPLPPEAGSASCRARSAPCRKQGRTGEYSSRREAVGRSRSSTSTICSLFGSTTRRPASPMPIAASRTRSRSSARSTRVVPVTARLSNDATIPSVAPA